MRERRGYVALGVSRWSIRYWWTEPEQTPLLIIVTYALLAGRRLRALTVVDAFTREALAIEVDQRHQGRAGRGHRRPLGAAARSTVRNSGRYRAWVDLKGSQPLGLRE